MNDLETINNVKKAALRTISEFYNNSTNTTRGKKSVENAKPTRNQTNTFSDQ